METNYVSRSKHTKPFTKSLVIHLDKYEIQYTGNQKKVYYYFYTFQSFKLIKQTKLRYSQIKSIVEKVQGCLNNWGYKRFIPPFPGKKLLGRTNDSQKDLSQRFIALSEYFKSFFSYKCLFYFPQIQRTFFKSKEYSQQNKRNYELRIELQNQQKIKSYKLLIYQLNTKRIHQINISYQFLCKLHNSLKKQNSLRMYQFPKRCQGSKQQIMKRKIDMENYFEVLLSQNIKNSSCLGYFLSLAINFKQVIYRL